MKDNIFKILVIVLIIALCVIGFQYYKLHSDYNELLDNMITASQLNDSTIVNDGIVSKNGHYSKDGQIWVSLEVFENFIDSEYRLSNSQLRIFLSSKNINKETDNAVVNRYLEEHLKEINIPLLYINNRPYLELDIIQKLYPVSANYNDKLNLLYIITNEQELTTGEALSKIDYFIESNDKYYKISELNKGEKFTVLKELDNYFLIVNEDGHMIYIEKTDKINIRPLSLEKGDLSYSVTNKLEPVSLTWDIVSSYDVNLLKNQFDFDGAVNVISPTWFNLNIEGIVINQADLGYVRRAKENGLQVWALSDNSFNINWTSQLLNDEAYQNNWLAETLMYVALYELDGINVDFENVYYEEKDQFTDFMKKISLYHNEISKSISIDLTRPQGSKNWSLFADREKISQYVDYIMLMAYDQHWGASPISGSVASYDWTKSSVEMSLKEIPKEKLVLGMPLYMRDWHASEAHQSYGSKAITISQFENYMKDKEAERLFDVDARQTYYVYYENGERHEIWVEDISSIDWRMNIYKEYDLAGVATWSKTFADDDVWLTIKKGLNNGSVIKM